MGDGCCQAELVSASNCFLNLPLSLPLNLEIFICTFAFQNNTQYFKI